MIVKSSYGLLLYFFIYSFFNFYSCENKEQNACNLNKRCLGCNEHILNDNCKIKTELYIGDNLLNENNLEEFLKSDILTKFEGFTIIEGRGGWKGNLFKSKILSIIHSGSMEDNAKIESIRTDFKNKFGHRSVMRVDTICSCTY